MYKTYGNTLKSITPDVLYPDAWKIKISIKDLTPNNFNTYINYFVNGFEGSTKILQSKLNQGAASLMNLVGDKFVSYLFGENATAAQKEWVNNIEAKSTSVVSKIAGTFMTQQDIDEHKRAAALSEMLNSMRSRNENNVWTFDARKFNIPLNNDGTPNTDKLKALGLDQKQINTIKDIYKTNVSKKTNLSDQEKRRIYTIIDNATKKAGADMYSSALNERAQAFMQETVSWQKNIYNKQGRQIPNESR